MALTKKQLADREYKLTASRVACLMTGDEKKILNLWYELVGDPNFTPEDLTYVWPVRLGEVTESLNLEWFSRKHGPLSHQGEVITRQGDAVSWAACTLDAWSETHSCPVEAKHVGGWEDMDTIIARYQPQMHWAMIVTKAKVCALSVIAGAKEPEITFVPFDQEYAAVLWDRAQKFMRCVWSLTPPVVLPAVVPPVVPVKEYDMGTNNVWVNAAADWLQNKAASKKFETASKSIKELMPDDGVRAYGGGISAKRNKAGHIRIGESDDASERAD